MYKLKKDNVVRIVSDPGKMAALVRDGFKLIGNPSGPQGGNEGYAHPDPTGPTGITGPESHPDPVGATGPPETEEAHDVEVEPKPEPETEQKPEPKKPAKK